MVRYGEYQWKPYSFSLYGSGETLFTAEQSTTVFIDGNNLIAMFF